MFIFDYFLDASHELDDITGLGLSKIYDKIRMLGGNLRIPNPHPLTAGLFNQFSGIFMFWILKNTTGIWYPQGLGFPAHLDKTADSIFYPQSFPFGQAKRGFIYQPMAFLKKAVTIGKLTFRLGKNPLMAIMVNGFNQLDIAANFLSPGPGIHHHRPANCPR